MVNGDYKRISFDVKLGEDVKVYAFVNLYGCEIGDESKIGTFVEIQRGVRIGRRVIISSHTIICEGVTIEDEVFVGHNVSFINDRYPRSTSGDGQTYPGRNGSKECTLVKRGASIGTSSTILCGVTIGENAIVGAGSVVTHDVPDHAIVAGNPARFLRWIQVPSEIAVGGLRQDPL
jgi:acetyltransferase-like isoleucine patch superfamily enzyme